ncbi:dTDP-4-dehydrorhamnose reductase [Arthroderma uncinatum]|uniref:dTDP-4-dehydrorhamnose reductase n=1 Tax=Arthroderma uncinatum TaxID=74035 RepID=UPI00144AAFA7|nr:dTDP-4-dehydrorhamnose reductase [Arthroderma uncinatum]KAF3479457.1 dTDP-4-dehydrorhamnose reductase [Arthroderma uncinatum]
MSRTALVTGASGLLGRQVLRTFQQDDNWKVTGQGFSRASPPQILKADLTVPAEIEKLLDDVKPQVVVHCAANRFPDKCDADPSLARKINVEATRALVHATASRSILLIYISTDYVFSGVEGEAPYEVSSPTNPPNIYGVTKRDGEAAVLEETSGSGLGVVLRIPVLYGPATTNSDSAVNVLLDAVKKAQDANAGVKMDDWSKRYPTHTEDVARVCRDIAVKYLDERQQAASLPAVLQFSSDVQTTKYKMCELFAELLGVSIPGMVRVTDGGKPGEGVQRPYDTHLSTRSLKDIGISADTQDFRAWW